MANPKGNPQNLKPFKEGDERINRKGAPKKLPPLDELMEKVMGEEKDGVTAMEAIIKALRAKAAKGDTKAAEMLLDRGYGKPKQPMDITSEGKQLPPPIINVVSPSQSDPKP